MSYRAQVRGVSGWVDGGLWVRTKDAEKDAARLAVEYERPVRVVPVSHDSASPTAEASDD